MQIINIYLKKKIEEPLSTRVKVCLEISIILLYCLYYFIMLINKIKSLMLSVL